MKMLIRLVCFIDQLLGLRAWGLILYGALPANLALLGVVKIELAKAEPKFLVAASIIPIVIIFLLIRSRHKEWYLTMDWLILRSLITTIAIVILASMITWVSGVLNNTYVPTSCSLLNFSCWSLDTLFKQGLSDAYLKGIASLVVSSAGFMALITKTIDLPGVPSSAMVTKLNELRKALIKLQNAPIWKKYSEENIGSAKVFTTAALEIIELPEVQDTTFLKWTLQDIYGCLKYYEKKLPTIVNDAAWKDNFDKKGSCIDKLINLNFRD